ncbi:MAG: hypothetical protein LBG81_08325 [Coriobacteriaceae bacterium]|nr:hypothetical protein [Coriobacteriaceae bacterium]
MTTLAICSITIRHDRAIVELRLQPGTPRYTSPQLIRQAEARFPQVFSSLRRHSCKNSEGPGFAAVIDHTPLPHLFEHLVIDLQVRRTEDRLKTFVGTSEWQDEAAGLARVEVSFTDDLSALRAFHDATRILDRAML